MTCLLFPSAEPTLSTPLYPEFATPSDEYSMPDVSPPEDPTESSPTTTNGDSQERLYQGLNDKLIPIYCSILAAVVVGLVAFIIFKK